jgi:uncharacterized OB-fold protein
MLPLPRPEIFPSPDAAPFWEACARRELQLPYCVECSEFFFYPRAFCPRCGSRALEWRRVSGRGRLHAFCIHHVSPLADFRAALPFVTVLVELDEGPRMMGFLVGVEPDPAAVVCELPLEVSFAELGDGRLLPVFRPR